MKISIKWEDIWSQLKTDLIGKDSHRGVTLTYSWLANQFGHFSLGYIPSLVVYSILLKHTTICPAAFWASLMVSLFWLLFELYNFLGPLLFRKDSKSKLLYLPTGKRFPFQPPWLNLTFDTFTDLCFFWVGSFSASLFLQFSLLNLSILLILALILVYPVYYWFVTKMYIQYAKLPIQFRLSQWKGDITKLDKALIYNFLNTNDKVYGKHLLIFGGRRTNKSSLGIGIATEFAIKRFSCIYHTGMKLYNLFSLTDKEIKKEEEFFLWSWRTASVLIIDDVNPENSISENFLSPKQVLALIDTPVNSDYNVRNRIQLMNKNVIWIMGNEDLKNDYLTSWKDMLLEMGVPDSKIYAVILN